MKANVIIFTLLFMFMHIVANGTIFKLVVKDKLAKKPIPFAHIKITDIDNNVDYSITDENGISEFDITADFNIEISCLGFRTINRNVSYSAYAEFYLNEDYLNLDQVVVTGTRTHKSLKDCPVLTQLITSKDIEKVDAVSIKDILQNEIPGLDFGRKGYGTSVSFLGLGAKYVLFLIDGERVAGETGGDIDYSMINPNNIERIEIIKGAGAALYGSNAIGGVINIITKVPKKKWSAESSFRYGEMNRKDYTNVDLRNASFPHYKKLYQNLDLPNINSNISLGYKGTSIFTNTNFNYKTADGYELQNSSGVDPFTVNGLKDYKINQKVGVSHNNFNLVLNGSYYNHHEYDFVENDNKHNNYEDIRFGAKSSFRQSDNSSFVLSWNRDSYKKNDFYEQNDSKKCNYQQTFNAVKAVAITKFSRNTITSGVEFLFEDLQTKMFEYEKLKGHGTSDLVLFVQDDITLLKDLNIMAGFRFGNHSAFNTHFTPSVSLKYRFNQFNYRGTYSRGFVSPTLKELYMNWDHMGMFQIVGDNDLKPEISNSYSGSVEYTSHDHQFNTSVTLYHTKIDDKIGGYWKSNKSVFQYANMDKSIARGMNILFKSKLAYGFTLKGSYAFTDNISMIDGRDVSTRSPHSVTAQFEYNLLRNNYSLNINISGKYTGSKEYDTLDDNDESFRVKNADFSVWKLTLNQKLGKHIGLTIGFNNVLNYKPDEYNFNSFTEPGRRFFTKVSYKL